MAVQLTPATGAPLDALAATLSSLPLLQSYGWRADGLRQALHRAQAQGALLWAASVDGGPPAGLIWFEPRGGLGRAGYLKLLAVAAQAQGRGVGAALMDHFERETRGAPGGQMLLCAHDNAAALRFYARRGYREVGSLLGFVRPGQTELLLHRPAFAPR